MTIKIIITTMLPAETTRSPAIPKGSHTIQLLADPPTHRIVTSGGKSNKYFTFKDDKTNQNINSAQYGLAGNL